MLNRSLLFRTAWQRARLQAGTRYGITRTLRQAFAIELKALYAERREQQARLARLDAGNAALRATLKAKPITIRPTFAESRQPWRYANSNAYGGL